MTEYLTRWCIAVPVPDMSANTIVVALLHHLILQHSCPKQLLSDQRTHFRGEVLPILTNSFGVTQLFTSPYHPQTNGLTERLNQTLKQIISSFVDPLHQNWDNVLPYVVHAYNTSA
jgi:transposase InsO family protein